MNEETPTKAERREHRRRRRIPKHGKSLGRIYKDSVAKRVRKDQKSASC